MTPEKSGANNIQSASGLARWLGNALPDTFANVLARVGVNLPWFHRSVRSNSIPRAKYLSTVGEGENAARDVYDEFGGWRQSVAWARIVPVTFGAKRRLGFRCSRLSRSCSSMISTAAVRASRWALDCGDDWS